MKKNSFKDYNKLLENVLTSLRNSKYPEINRNLLFTTIPIMSNEEFVIKLFSDEFDYNILDLIFIEVDTNHANDGIMRVIIQHTVYYERYVNIMKIKPPDLVISVWLHLLDPILRRAPSYNWIDDGTVANNDCLARTYQGFTSLLRSHSTEQYPIVSSREVYSKNVNGSDNADEDVPDADDPDNDQLDPMTTRKYVDEYIVTYIIYGVHQGQKMKNPLSNVSVRTNRTTRASLYYKKYIPIARYFGNHWEFYNFLIIPPKTTDAFYKLVEKLCISMFGTVNSHDLRSNGPDIPQHVRSYLATTHDIEFENIPLGPSMYKYARNYVFIKGDFLPPIDHNATVSSANDDEELIPMTVVTAGYLFLQTKLLHKKRILYKTSDSTRHYNAQAIYIMFNQSMATIRNNVPNPNFAEYYFANLYPMLRKKRK